MQITAERLPMEKVDADALVVPVFEEEKDTRFGAGPLQESGELTGKAQELTLLHNVHGMSARRVLLAGAGKRSECNPAVIRNLAGAAVRFLKGKSLKRIAWALEPPCDSADYASAAVEGAILGNYEPDRYQTANHKKPVEALAVTSSGGGPGLEEAVARGRILAESQNLARELANEPANKLTPLKIAETARNLADEFSLGCEVLEQQQMQSLGMGALLGVAQGSAEPPVLIVLKYQPANADGGGKVHLGLVGKGVTFDTGGISIKPADGMEKMKYDMSGGADMIAAMRAIAQLKPAIPVSAFIPCVENMPGSRAQRPGDIVTALSGKTVEVINTDAEGRLILADALEYAKRQGCTHLVDAATLTGAIVVALGHLNVGLFANNDAMRDRVMAAAKAEGERMWAMPLEDDYKEYLKSAFADLANVGGRWGGAITAAIFLREFAGETPWVHLDIAGTAWLDDPKPYAAKGPTGVAVRTLVRLATDWRE